MEKCLKCVKLANFVSPQQAYLISTLLSKSVTSAERMTNDEERRLESLRSVDFYA